jgi:hypothetical protein
MGLHKPFDRDFFLVNGNVLTSGGSKNLAKGQFAIVDVKSATANGAKVISDVSGAPSNTTFEFRVGKSKVQTSRSAQNSKAYSTFPFKISNVKEVSVSSPTITSQTFDDLIIGYDGIDATSAMKFANGDTTVLDVILKGKAIGLIGEHNEYKFKIHFGVVEGQTDQEVVEAAVRRLKEEVLPTGIPISHFIDIKIIDSTRASLTGSEYAIATLSVTDAGDSIATGLVQAKYQSYDVVRTDRIKLVSTYSVLHKKSEALANYQGTTWVDGDTLFASTESYTIQLADNPGGSSRLTELQAAYPTLTIEGGEATGAATQELTLTGNSGTANISVANVDYLATFNTNLTTTASDFVTAHAAAILSDTGAVVTSNGVIIKFSDDAEGFPTIEIANATSNLNGTLGAIDFVTTTAEGGCQRVYSTTVVTDVVGQECDTIFVQNFTSQAPQDFDFVSWEKVEYAPDASALMGIRLTGKEIVVDPEEWLKDEVPFYETSARIIVAGGYIEEVNRSTNQYNKNFAVKTLGWATDRDHLGANLRAKEEEARVYFDGELRHRNNNFAKYFLGEESVIVTRAQYVDYSIVVKDDSYSQSFGSTLNASVAYHFHIEVGSTAAFEAEFNKIAVKAGLDAVSA